MDSIETAPSSKKVARLKAGAIRAVIFIFEALVLVGIPAVVLLGGHFLRRVLGATAAPTFPLQFMESARPDWNGYEIFITYYLIAFPLLLLTRGRQGRAKSPLGLTAYLTTTWAVFAGLFASLLWSDFLPKYRSILLSAPPGVYSNAVIPIPVSVHLTLPVAYWIIPFLFGMRWAGRGGQFKFLRFALGFLSAELFLMSVTHARPPWHFWSVVDSTLMLIVASGPILMSGTRRELERLAGVSLGTGPIAPAAPRTWLGAALGHLSLGVLALMIPALGFLGYCVRAHNQVWDNDPEPIHRSPALRNVYEEWKDLFGERRACQSQLRKSFQLRWIDMIAENNTPPELISRVIDGLNLEDCIEQDIEQRRPYLDALEKAREADYLDLRGDQLHGGNMLVAFRGYFYRGLIRMRQNRLDEAIHDIETLYYADNLMRGGTIATNTLGANAHRNATQLAYYYYLQFRDDGARLEQLEKSLRRMEPLVHVSYDLEGMRRHEPAFWTVMLKFEYTEINWNERLAVYYANWAGFDSIVLACALERFRQDHGAYPETLDPLAPDYVARLPVDPIDGSPFHYRNLGDEFELTSNVMQKVQKMPRPKRFPVFPPSRMDNPELREKFAMCPAGQ